MIRSIKWNGRVQDITFNGDKTGTQFKFDEAIVTEYSRKRVEKIEEVNLTTYDIYYSEFGRKTKLRVFNPIEVLFEL